MTQNNNNNNGTPPNKPDIVVGYNSLDDIRYTYKKFHLLGGRELTIGDISKIISGQIKPPQISDISVHGLDINDAIAQKFLSNNAEDTLSDVYRREIDTTGAVEAPAIHFSHQNEDDDDEQEIPLGQRPLEERFMLSKKQLRFAAQHNDKLAPKFEMLANAFYNITQSQSVELLADKITSQKFDKNLAHVWAIDPVMLLNTQQITEKLEQYSPYSRFCVGIQPDNFVRLKKYEKEVLVTTLKQLGSKVVAIGPVGVNMHYTGTLEREQLLVAFEHYVIAHKLGLPVLFTQTGAVPQMKKLFTHIEKTFGKVQGAIVCPVNSDELAELVQQHHLHVLLRPEIDYPNHEKYRAFAKKLPIKQVLLGCGADRHALSDKIGQWNTPDDVRVLLEQSVCGLYKKTLAAMQQQLNDNFIDFFQLNRTKAKQG